MFGLDELVHPILHFLVGFVSLEKTQTLGLNYGVGRRLVQYVGLAVIFL